jgi:tetratricopeptide (TPR) repeat protein
MTSHTIRLFLGGLLAGSLLLAAPSAFAQGLTGAQDEAVRLAECRKKIETAPDQAYEDGLAWMTIGARPAARYCVALALIGLGQEEEGALRLEQLANAKDGGTLDARAVILGQAGNAWLLAGKPDAAIVAFGNAIKIVPSNAEGHKDRARAYMIKSDWESAGKDLDTAIELSPGDGEALRMRGHNLMKLKRYDDAWADAVASLKANPKDVEAALLRGELREAARKDGRPDPAG